MNLKSFENKIFDRVSQIATPDDPAHDILHFQRVVRVAKILCAQESGNLDIVMPSAWLHDFVIIPKNDPRRSQASRLSAESAIVFLREIGFPEQHYSAIAHAIAAHSFSAQIEPETLEAKIVQDADRLDGLGAIGIARCFATAGIMRRPFYSEEDPFCHERMPNDKLFTIDHFFVKLFNTAESLKTQSARVLGLKRVETMRRYLKDLGAEIFVE
jgi:uncharacterized protein